MQHGCRRICAVVALAIGLHQDAVAPAVAHWGGQRPDGHAPIGVTGDHVHSRGEWMLSYRYMYMAMQGSRDGTTSVSDQAVVDPAQYDFQVTPTEMPMAMSMFGVMYAPRNHLTLMAMVNVMTLRMEHVTRSGATFETQSQGLGDVTITALVVLHRWERQQLHLNAGVSIPTGSITESDVTPASAPAQTQLPYPMQLGSGTWDLIPGLTYLGQVEHWGWGAQAKGAFRMGTNENGYSLGPTGLVTAWGSRVLNKYVSVSARVAGNAWGNIDGQDPAYDTAVSMRTVPTVFPDLRGGRRIDLGTGVNFFVPEGSSLHNLRIAAEVLLPVYQDLDGPQLETDWWGVVGVQYSH